MQLRTWFSQPLISDETPKIWLLDLGGHSGGPMNVQKPTALDNKLTVPMRPTQAAVTAERPFQQQMQQALSSVDNLGKDVDSVLDGLHSSVNLQAEVRKHAACMSEQWKCSSLYKNFIDIYALQKVFERAEFFARNSCQFSVLLY